MSETKLTTKELMHNLHLVAEALEREGREKASDTCIQAAARLRELEQDAMTANQEVLSLRTRLAVAQNRIAELEAAQQIRRTTTNTHE